MTTLEEAFAIGDDALILVGLLLLLTGSLWGILAIVLGLAWKYLEGEFRFSPFKKGGKEEAKEETPEEFEYLEEEAEEGGGEESEGEGEEGEEGEGGEGEE